MGHGIKIITQETDDKDKNLEYLFNSTPLYTKEIFNVFELNETGNEYNISDKEYAKFAKYVGFETKKIVTFCHKCKRTFPFNVDFKYINFYNDINRNHNYMIVSSDDVFNNVEINIENGEIIGSVPPFPKKELLNNKIWYVEYSFECTNDSNHLYMMLVTIELKDGKFIVRKVGQNPSMLSIKGFDFDKYERELKLINAYDDYKKADMCNAEQYYAGAYTYLRRIFEKMLNSFISEKEYDLTTTKKIDKTKDKFDPRVRDMLKELYSILSESIHTLDDEKSKYYYETLKAVIDMELEYEYTETEKSNQMSTIKSKLSKIKYDIKKEN